MPVGVYTASGTKAKVWITIASSSFSTRQKTGIPASAYCTGRNLRSLVLVRGDTISIAKADIGGHERVAGGGDGGA